MSTHILFTKVNSILIVTEFFSSIQLPQQAEISLSTFHFLREIQSILWILTQLLVRYQTVLSPGLGLQQLAILYGIFFSHQI